MTKHITTLYAEGHQDHSAEAERAEQLQRDQDSFIPSPSSPALTPYQVTLIAKDIAKRRKQIKKVLQKHRQHGSLIKGNIIHLTHPKTAPLIRDLKRINPLMEIKDVL